MRRTKEGRVEAVALQCQRERLLAMDYVGVKLHPLRAS